ncbi:hypothetical protein Tco_0637916 [Tanacetum coccineum]
MDLFQLRMKTFPLSLSREERKWWMNEGDGKINTWEELVNKSFNKFYPLSCTSNYDKMCDDDEEDRDPLEFITWRNSKFKNHKKVDETTKRALLHSWIKVGNNEGIMDEDVSFKEKLTCAPVIGTKNVAADHLSRIENDEISDDSEVDDNFPGETLMEINTKDEPWFAIHPDLHHRRTFIVTLTTSISTSSPSSSRLHHPTDTTVTTILTPP